MNTEPIARTRRIIFTAPVEETSQVEEVPAPHLPLEAELTAQISTEGMSLAELRAHEDELKRQIQEKEAAEKQAVIDQIVNVVHAYSIPIDELVTALGGLKIKRQGVKAIQKYKDPATGATWSGRGKEPVWIRGKKRDKFLIKD